MMDSLRPVRLEEGRVLIGFDPGRDKCGLAVVQVRPVWQVLHREVVLAGEAPARLQSLWQQFGAERVILGNQTTAQAWKHQLESLIPRRRSSWWTSATARKRPGGATGIFTRREDGSDCCPRGCGCRPRRTMIWWL